MPGTSRRWVVTVPPGTALLTANQRYGHWAVPAARTRVLRDIAGWAARAGHWPAVTRVHVTLEVVVPSRHRRDPENWMPSAKALLDGLVAAGFLPDDSYRHVTGPDPRLVVEPSCQLHLRLVITENTQNPERQSS